MPKGNPCITKKQFCKYGHDTFICGRNPANGCCKLCAKEIDKKSHLALKEGRRIRISKKQFCLNGHDTLIIGRTQDGACKECRRLKKQKKYIPHPSPKIQFCPKGHDTFVVGREKSGTCKGCAKIKSRVKGWKGKGIINIDGSPFTFIDYDRLYQIQGGRCANMVCNKHQSELTKIFHVDHDHKTGFVRGLLCNSCNIKLGALESKECVGLTDYLREHKVVVDPSFRYV